MRCKVPGCKQEARPRGRTGRPPTTCVEHAPPPRRRSARMATPADPGEVPLLEGAQVEGPRVRVRLQATPPGQRDALGRCLREIARQAQQALAILSGGVTPWVCPRCGSLARTPLHGADERLRCPNDDCDAVVAVDDAASQAQTPKKPGHAWRGTAGTVVPRSARG
ncbi:MAG: hypothetical protein KF878_00230 [Planctomycetes bacterium]|nr:hypothetical protein [Planctomycetota bacterium]